MGEAQDTNTTKEKLLAEYDKCARTGEPSVPDFCNKHARIFRATATQSDDAKGRELLACVFGEVAGAAAGILVPVETLQSAIQIQNTGNDTTTGRPHADCLRQIQLQVMLRLKFWSSYGEDFARVYALHMRGSSHRVVVGPKKKKRDKRGGRSRRQPPHELLLHDVTSILSLAAFLLDPDCPFPNFVRDCLPTLSSSICASFPADTFARIYSWFEIQDPAIAEKQKNALVLLLSPPRKRKRSSESRSSAVLPAQIADDDSMPLSSSLSASEKRSKNSNDNNKKTDSFSSLLLPKRVQLTAPTVKKTNSLLSTSGRAQFVGSHFNTSLSNMGSLFRQVKSTKVVVRNNNKPTKCKRHPLSPHNKRNNSHQQRYSRIVVQETPSKTTTKAGVVADTPTKKAPTAAVSLFGEEEAARRKPTGASLVAQARRSLLARQERRSR